jgi:hypothetical protein
MKAQESEARALPHAARVFGHATRFIGHLHSRILVEA